MAASARGRSSDSPGGAAAPHPDARLLQARSRSSPGRESPGDSAQRRPRHAARCGSLHGRARPVGRYLRRVGRRGADARLPRKLERRTGPDARRDLGGAAEHRRLGPGARLGDPRTANPAVRVELAVRPGSARSDAGRRLGANRRDPEAGRDAASVLRRRQGSVGHRRDALPPGDRVSLATAPGDEDRRRLRGPAVAAGPADPALRRRRGHAADVSQGAARAAEPGDSRLSPGPDDGADPAARRLRDLEDDRGSVHAAVRAGERLPGPGGGSDAGRDRADAGSLRHEADAAGGARCAPDLVEQAATGSRSIRREPSSNSRRRPISTRPSTAVCRRFG